MSRETKLDPRFAVGEPVPEEGQVGREAQVRLDRAMRGGIERIVHGHATRRSEASQASATGGPPP
ncbi:MAG: hypothetical protein ACM3IG_07340 [Myxococcales bacterium]